MKCMNEELHARAGSVGSAHTSCPAQCPPGADPRRHCQDAAPPLSVLQKIIPGRLHTTEVRYQDFSVSHCAQEYRLLEVNKPLGVLVQTSVSRTFAPVWWTRASGACSHLCCLSTSKHLLAFLQRGCSDQVQEFAPGLHLPFKNSF